MVHNFRVCIELSYDDINGEYVAPTTKEIEVWLGRVVIKPAVKDMGFVGDINIEAERID